MRNGRTILKTAREGNCVMKSAMNEPHPKSETHTRRAKNYAWSDIIRDSVIFIGY